ncbi:MAG: DMT family transporter [Peptococcaceae bacterium]|nr:DMT family transporter [Peptococcaceae bacterium]
MGDRLLPLLAITLTAIIWGLSFVSIKISVAVIPPMTLALLRFLLASAILVVMLKILEPQARLKKEDVPSLLIAGIIGITLYFFFENNGVKLTTATVASMIIAFIPILTILADYIIFKSPMPPYKIACVLISVVGVYLVVGANITGLNGSGNLRGNLLMMGAALSWVVYSIVTRPIGKRRSQLYIVTYQTIFGTLCLIPFSLLEMDSWQRVSLPVILNVAFLGVFCSALGYYLYVYAMRGLGMGVVSLFINLIPVVTVVSSYFILKETVTLAQMAGGFLIVASVYLTSWRSQPRVRAVHREVKQKPV